MLARYLLPAALLATVPVAFAQQAQTAAPAATQSAAQQLSPQQQAAIAQLKQRLAQHGEQVASQVDQGKYGDVWDGFSNVAKPVVRRDDFIKAVTADRAKLGGMASRKVAVVTLTQSKGGKLPAGLYGNVVFATQFANEKQPVRELISFHFDSDKVWRTSGYTVH
ncbi:MAG TPA: DUF4019 domain-containing protein [Rhodanobacteraceae bacterium]|nr:DUF4019 domain-containing protein [Rhodanobacteraceae bacterium]